MNLLAERGRFFIRQTFLLLLVLVFTVEAAGSEADPANYAFANYLGSGFYQTSGGAVTVFKAPLSYTPKQPGDNVIKWRLPLTFGFFNFDFDPGDIGDIELPKEVGTFSFVPGLEKQYYLNSRWTLIPYVDFGLTKNFSSKENVIVYSAGVTAERQLSWIGERHFWSNKVWYAAYNVLKTEKRDDFATLQTGLDISLPWHPSRRVADMRWTAYALGAAYIRPIRFTDEKNEMEKVRASIELGVTLKSTMLGEKYLWGLNQIGIGYRDANKVRVWRLVLGSPF